MIGSTIQLSEFPHTVVGVAPRGMEEPALSGISFAPPRLWRSTPSCFRTNGRGSRSFTAIARLKPGVTLGRAQQELTAIHEPLAERHPAENANHFLRVVPLKEHIVGDVRPVLLLLFGAVTLVLLIACVNVANLLLFRSAGRAREISSRAALGASRRNLVQYLMAESLILALAGGALGVGLAQPVASPASPPGRSRGWKRSASIFTSAPSRRRSPSRPRCSSVCCPHCAPCASIWPGP